MIVDSSYGDEEYKITLMLYLELCHYNPASGLTALITTEIMSHCHTDGYITFISQANERL